MNRNIPFDAAMGELLAATARAQSEMDEQEAGVAMNGAIDWTCLADWQDGLLE